MKRDQSQNKAASIFNSWNPSSLFAHLISVYFYDISMAYHDWFCFSNHLVCFLREMFSVEQITSEDLCCLSAFCCHSPEVRMITFQGHHPHIQYNNSISSLQPCSSQKSPLVLSSSFLPSQQGKKSRQRIEREQCDYCQDCLPQARTGDRGCLIMWYSRCTCCVTGASSDQRLLF